MKEKKDQFEQFIADSFEKLAKQEEEKIEKESDIQMPEHVRESIRVRLDDEIKKLEEKKAYEHLSEEDRRALELGRRMLRGESQESQNTEDGQTREETAAGSGEETPAGKKWSGRKKLKVCLVLAAVLVLVMAISITGLGGPERVIQMLTQEVGDREVEQVDSSDENLVIVEEDEEEAYQMLNEEYGVEVVKIISSPQNMTFNEVIYDPIMQLAEMVYNIDDEKIVLYINASYYESSFGVDMEDVVTDDYVINNKKCEIYVTEYDVKNQEGNKYSARFSYNGLEYSLVGQLSKKDFEEILKSLYFYL